MNSFACAMSRCYRLFGGFLLVLVLLHGGATWAATNEDAEAWLMKLGPAMNMNTYRGVFVYSRGDQVNSMSIAHRYRDGEVDERLVLLDGASGEILRRGNEVLCILPKQGQVDLDQVIPSGPFAGAFASKPLPVGSWYQPELLGDDRIAGYPAVVIALQPRDHHRYGYRLWLDRQTGLLLKSHVRMGDEVLERFQFTTLEIMDQLPDSEFEVSADARVRELKPRLPVSKGDWAREGWRLGWRPEGFLPVSSPQASGASAVAFSDGLATFSVFVEPAEGLRMPEGASRIGATTVYMHYAKQQQAAAEGFLVTVVGEIPPPTAMRIAQSVAVDDSDSLARSPGQ